MIDIGGILRIGSGMTETPARRFGVALQDKDAHGQWRHPASGSLRDALRILRPAAARASI